MYAARKFRLLAWKAEKITFPTDRPGTWKVQIDFNKFTLLKTTNGSMQLFAQLPSFPSVVQDGVDFSRPGQVIVVYSRVLVAIYATKTASGT